MKCFFRTLLVALTVAICTNCAKAAGWPANFEGVMLQAFYWESYKNDTKWTTLEANADELSQYFKVIWVPNGARAATSPSMGYDAVYWFTNYSSSFGNEQQLRSMISTFKSKGTDVIADLIINHRSGTTNWTNFPSEYWDGKVWKLGPEHICCTDEVRNQPGQATPTGAADTGEDFNGARDLDHTNATVQDNCKNYCRFLLDDMGFSGFRLDMVKGYAGRYTKMYNEYSKPTYSVGEYWDGSYDACAAWVESTGRTSAVFDYPFKYAVNKAFGGGNLSELVWKANGTINQPAGLIHFGYPQYSVTFIENHDTEGNGTNAFSGNVLAANAFMLCSPGTPCVFYRHWLNYKDKIKDLIAVRNSVGVNNMSTVNVLQTGSSIYMAEVIGTKGKLVVRIGNSGTPAGYTDADIKASGNGYCVWSKNDVQGGGNNDPNPNPNPDPNPGNYPSNMYLVGHVNGTGWSTTASDAIAPAEMGNGKYIWRDVTVDAAPEATVGYFSFITVTGTDWDSEVNQGDRYGATSKDCSISLDTPSGVELFAAGVNASAANSWKADAGTYNFVLDLTTMSLTLTHNDVQLGGNTNPNPNPNPDPNPDPNPGNYPSNMYLVGHVNGTGWSTTASDAIAQSSKSGGEYIWRNVTVDAAPSAAVGYFSFITVTGSDWDSEVNQGDRYGATSKDCAIALDIPSAVELFAAGVNASAANSWMAEAGTYNFILDLDNKTLTITKRDVTHGIESVEADDAPAVYYNLQGVRIDAADLDRGIYIKVCGNKASKVLVK